jgi:hypothetical protein
MGHFIWRASNFESLKFELWKLKYKVIILYDTLQENMTFHKVQLDLNVYIDEKVWLFWLKAWGMKDMSYFWLKHLTKVTFLTIWQTRLLLKKAKSPSRWPKFSQINHTQ